MGYGYLYPRETDRVTWHFGGLELKNLKKKKNFFGVMVSRNHVGWERERELGRDQGKALFGKVQFRGGFGFMAAFAFCG